MLAELYRAMFGLLIEEYGDVVWDATPAMWVGMGRLEGLITQGEEKELLSYVVGRSWCLPY